MRCLYGKILDRGLDSMDRAQGGLYKKDQGLIFLHKNSASKVNKSFIIIMTFFTSGTIYPFPMSTEIIGNIRQFSESFGNV